MRQVMPNGWGERERRGWKSFTIGLKPSSRVQQGKPSARRARNFPSRAARRRAAGPRRGARARNRFFPLMRAPRRAAVAPRARRRRAAAGEALAAARAPLFGVPALVARRTRNFTRQEHIAVHPRPPERIPVQRFRTTRLSGFNQLRDRPKSRPRVLAKLSPSRLAPAPPREVSKNRVEALQQ